MILHAKENLEDFIVKLLAESSGFSVSEIIKRISEDHKKFTLQAVYKELRKLQNGGVVVKLKHAYSLRLPWILDFVSLADTISNTYLDSPSLTSILPDRHKKEIWHFNNLMKLNNFWSHVLLTLIQQSKKKTLLGWNPHPWFHIIQTKQEEQYIKSLGIAKGKLYLIIGGNTYLDRWAERFFNKKVVEYSFGKSVFEKDRSTYVNVIDDYIVTVKLDGKTTQLIESLYKNTNSAEQINISATLAVFNGKVKSSLWLEKNPQKAEILKNRFNRFFGIRL